MNGVFIIPTGIGCKIGGHAGDATPAAKLVASVCDNLIIHPNVVNASDINEMTDNMLYVEGSQLDAFLYGHHNLKKVQSNKILVVVNRSVDNSVINSVSAARATLGADIEIMELARPLVMVGDIEADGTAGGSFSGHGELLSQLISYKFDALAIISKIEINKQTALNYANYGGVNPWGGIEAKVSNFIAKNLGVPVAHAPFGHTLSDYNNIVNPCMAAEFVSVSYMHCVLKGLYKAPRLVRSGGDLAVGDIDFLVSPFGCYGPPHVACVNAGIPIIYVKENTTILNKIVDHPLCITVENYLEAMGVISALKIGISIESVRRPLAYTKVRMWE